ncbi:putative UDP-glycosyltransferase 79B6-like [Capsicum annuum]|nr:putative UDP-glycosyltransferase 79B6-like [Capsicum annuum]
MAESMQDSTPYRIRLQNLNFYPHLITFHKLTIPHVDGPPYGAENTANVPGSLETLLATAMDELYDEIKSFLENLKPHFVIFDFAYWIPELALQIGGIKTVSYRVVCPDKTTFMTSTAAELVKPPPGYPSTTVVLRECEAKLLQFLFDEYGKGVTFLERMQKSRAGCDTIPLKTCREVEGTFGDFAAKQLEKPILYTGAVLPELKNEPLEEHGLSNRLEKFEPGSVVFCALGSQTILQNKQFQELVLGLELTESPFLLAVKPPEETNSIEEALPEGFKQRAKEKGLILDCWVPQLKILSHKSVGCFVSHCGYGSMWESLALCDCQLVFLPRFFDHLLNARLMEHELKVGVEVEEENDLFTKENLCKAVKCMMDKDSQIACSMKENHRKWKELLSSPGFMSNYIDNFIHNLHGLLLEQT